MDTSSIIVPKGTLKEQINYLMTHHSELSRQEMADLLGKNVSTVYSYVHDFKKEQAKKETQPQEQENKKKQAQQQTKKETQPQAVKERTSTLSDEEVSMVLEELQNLKNKKNEETPEATTSEQSYVEPPPPTAPPTAPLDTDTQIEMPFDEPVHIEPVVEIETSIVQPIRKAPEAVELSLTKVNGAHLQSLLFNLLKNSLSCDEEYSFALTLEKSK